MRSVYKISSSKKSSEMSGSQEAALCEGQLPTSQQLYRVSHTTHIHTYILSLLPLSSTSCIPYLHLPALTSPSHRPNHLYGRTHSSNRHADHRGELPTDSLYFTAMTNAPNITNDTDLQLNVFESHSQLTNKNEAININESL